MQGSYAFRFSGHPVRGRHVFYIVGVGMLHLEQAGRLKGNQTSTITQFGDLHAKLECDRFDLDGTLTWDGDMGHAAILFTTPEQKLTGEFAVVRAGSDDRLWLTSTKTTLHKPEGDIEVNEIVSGEAVRIGAP